MGLRIPARRVRGDARRRKPHIALVCSHGGHLTELLALRTAWDEMSHFWLTYDAPRTRQLPDAYRMRNIGFNPLLMLVATIRTLLIFARERPNVVITDGAEIAIPAVLVARVLGCRIIFVEVWTRVRLPTLTGRIVYPLSDAFFVMWPELLDSYGPKARYEGGLV
jgi:UDP-N-acetylglucosamine:LPS N-acetylglucosamine transferase